MTNPPCGCTCPCWPCSRDRWRNLTEAARAARAAIADLSHDADLPCPLCDSNTYCPIAEADLGNRCIAVATGSDERAAIYDAHYGLDEDWPLCPVCRRCYRDDREGDPDLTY